MAAKRGLRALVTGGLGCLGSAVSDRLVTAGWWVRILDRSGEAGQLSGRLAEAELVSCSILDPAEVARACQGVDTVFHLAARVHDRLASDDELWVANVEGTRVVLEAARRAGVRRFVFYSTVGVYGRTTGVGLNESTPTAPATVYARSKLEAEQLVLASPLEVVVLRFPVSYGPRDRGNVSNLIRTIASKRFFFVGHGRNRRSMLAAENAAAAAVLAAESDKAPGEVFIATDGLATSLAEVVRAVTLALGADWRPPNLPPIVARSLAFAGDVLRSLGLKRVPFDSDVYRKLFGEFVLDDSKARRMLGYEPTAELSAGMGAEVQWMRSTGMLLR